MVGGVICSFVFEHAVCTAHSTRTQHIAHTAHSTQHTHRITSHAQMHVLLVSVNAQFVLGK